MHVARVLVPVDFSDPSLRALSWAADLAALAGASVTLLYVGADETPERGTGVAQQDLLRLGAERIPDSIVRSAVVRRGHPRDEILGEITDGAHDLVVIGSSRRPGHARALLGSVAEAIVRLSPVPVLVSH